jgi:large repetitive protein
MDRKRRHLGLAQRGRVVKDDAGGPGVDKTFTLQVNPLPVITTGNALLSTVTATFSKPQTFTGGTTPFIGWGLLAGDALPPGLSLNPSDGTIFGSPTTAGTTSFTIVLTDANLAQATRTFNMTVNAAPSITSPATLPGWAVGAGGYPSTTMTATGGTGSYTWSWTAPILPPGLAMSTGGVISGTPTAAGIYGSIAVKVTDSVGVSVTRTYSITITGPLSITGPPSLPSWDVGVAYPTTTLTAGGGSGGYVWSSSTLPPGLVINSGTGVITGTPTTAGPYPAVVLRVTDSNGVIATRSYSMTVYSALAYTGPGTLPNWVAGTAYPAQNFTVSGGSGSNTWSATGLPPGLSVSAGGVLSGTPSPTGVGTFNAINFSVSDGAGGGFAVGPFSMTIYSALGISTAGVPSAGVVGVPYNGSLSAVGGSGTFSWSATGLPAGVTMSSGGVLSGSPTTNSTYSVNFTLTDNGTGGVGSPPASATVAFTIKTYQPLAWGTLPTPPSAWTAGFTYPTQNFPTAGGLPSISWSATGLPTGMSINTGTGAISGVPTAVGATTVTVTAKDALNQTVTRTFSLTINPALVLTGTLPNGALGVSYTGGLTRTPGTGTGSVTWSSSALPTGLLAINASTGAITGTPTVTGSFPVTVTVTDAVGATASLLRNIIIPPTPTMLAITEGNGNTNGKAEKGDKIVVTFSEALQDVSICSAWTTSNPVQTLGAASGLTVTIVEGGLGNDQLTIATATGCTFNFGTINLGSAAYVTGSNVTFGGSSSPLPSTVDWDSGAKTLTVVLGAQGGTGSVPGGQGAPPSDATYTPSGNMQSTSGVPITGTISTGNRKLF